MAQKTVDIISDVHIDTWVKKASPLEVQELFLHKLIGKLLPDKPSNVLVIAGDIGHYNDQNAVLFKILRQYYKDIVWVHGNHDLYMISNSIMKKYKWNSFNRLNEMIELSNAIDGVHYLNGDTIEVDGIKISGCGMWYNNDYAKKVWNSNDTECKEMWDAYLNDSTVIKTATEKQISLGYKLKKNARVQLEYVKYSNELYEKLKKVYLEGDVILTHISPDWSHLLTKWQFPQTTFYHFDGSELLENLDENKLWVFGHTHDKYFYQHHSGCYMACNPLDYGINFPNWFQTDIYHRRIVTMDVGKQKGYEEVFK